LEETVKAANESRCILFNIESNLVIDELDNYFAIRDAFLVSEQYRFSKSKRCTADWFVLILVEPSEPNKSITSQNEIFTSPNYKITESNISMNCSKSADQMKIYFYTSLTLAGDDTSRHGGVVCKVTPARQVH